MRKPNLNPTKKELRIFGLVILVGFSVIGGVLFYHSRREAAQGVWLISAIVAGLAFCLPRATKPVYLLWTYIGLAVGFVASRIVMMFIFYGILTPLGLFFLWRRRDPLSVRKRTADTYWIDHEKIEDKTYYDHLF